MKIHKLDVDGLAIMTENILDQNNRTTQMAPVIEENSTGYAQLANLLNVGPTAIMKQIRYVLMLSQVLGKKTSVNIIPQRPLTTHHARLQSLVNMADALSDEHLQRIYKEIEQIRNAKIRLRLLVQLAPFLPQQYDVMHNVWKQLNTLADPVAETGIIFQLAPLLPYIEDRAEKPSILAQIVEIILQLNNMDARIKGLTALYPFLPDDAFETYVRAILDELYEEQDDELCSKSLRTLAEYLPETSADNALVLVDRIRSASFRAYALTALARYLPVETYPRLHEKALDTIAIIEDEEERADALQAFTANLESAEEDKEYPKLLEQALLIAISIETPQNRAQVLVALAPNLTGDLQREAVAAVQQLDDEREQSELLSELVPTLSEDMLLKALAIANTFEILENRAQTLTILAQYVPQHVRQQTMMDALYAASNLPNPYERVQALVNIRYWLPHVLQEEVLHRTLDTIAEMENNSAKARALNYLAEHLNVDQLEDALEIAREITNPQIYLNAGLGFLPHFAGDEQRKLVNELLDCVHNIRLAYKRAQALISLIPYLEPHQLLQALQMAESITDALDQINVYSNLAEHMPTNEREILLNKALIRLKRITDGYDRAIAMINIMPNLEPEKRTELQTEVYETIQRATDAYDKAGTIVLLVPFLEGETLEAESQLPDVLTILQKAFERAVHITEQKTRADLLHQGALLWVQYSDAEASYRLWKHLAQGLISLPLADVLLCLEAIRPILQQIAGKDYTKAIAYILGMR